MHLVAWKFHISGVSKSGHEDCCYINFAVFVLLNLKEALSSYLKQKKLSSHNADAAPGTQLAFGASR